MTVWMRGFVGGRRRVEIVLAGVSMLVMVPAAARSQEALRARPAAEPAPSIIAIAPEPAVPKGAGQVSLSEVSLSIPRGSLEPALVAFTEQAGVKLVYATALTERLTTGGVEGVFQPLDALARILDGTGLTYRAVGPSTITLVNPRYVQLGGDPSHAVTLDELSVEGQRAGSVPVPLAGLPPASGTVGQLIRPHRSGPP